MTKMRKTLLVAVSLLFGTMFCQAQEAFSYQPDAPLPVNEDIKVGKLKNGLTYYIRKNALPENKVELRLVVNAGSVLENDDQRGLAHFTEHMAFNGTRDFPGNAIIDRLEEIGVRFGADLNAYTSFDETVYMLPVPKEHIDLGLSVLVNWAFYLNMTDEDIDGERGVILEELRLGRGAGERMAEKYYPVLLGGSKYPERMPIGKEEVLKNFSYETIRSFYDNWYRPDNIAVVVVGDMNPDEVEAKIKDLFGKEKNPRKAPERKEEIIPTFKGSKAVVVTDREMPTTQIQVYFRVGEKENKTQGDYIEDIEAGLYGEMLSSRLQEIVRKPGAPFMYAGAGYSTLLRRTKAFNTVAVCAPGGAQAAFKCLQTEAQRAKLYGFTQGELDRAKAAVLSRFEQSYANRGKMLSSQHLGELQRNFLVGESIPGIEYEYALIKAALPGITLEKVNSYGDKLITEDNRVVMVIGPEGLPYPSEKELLDIFAAVDADKTIKPYEDKMAVKQLMDKTPVAGKVVAEKTHDKSGVIEWTLSNGATVYLKPTTFKDDEILMSASSKGGRSLYEAADDRNIRFATQILSQSGINGISATDLSKFLTGKNVRISPAINAYTETLSGQYVKKDAKTAFELMYLYFTAPYFSQEAFELFVKNGKARASLLMEDPEAYFSYKTTEFLSNGNPRALNTPLAADYDGIDLARVEEIYRERFAGADDFNFYFVGSFTPEDIKPYVETYIASLPAKGVKENYKDITSSYPAAKTEKVFNKGVDAKANVRFVFNKTDVKYDRKTAFDFTIFSSILSTRLLKSLREEMGGTYSVGARGTAYWQPKDEAEFIIAFSSNIEKYTELYERAMSDLKELYANGPTAEEVAAKKEQNSLQWIEQTKTNRYWLSILSGAVNQGLTPDDALKTKEYIDALNADDVKAAAQKYLEPENWIRIICLPEAK